MHMIMVEKASGFDWLTKLEVPENVWTTITIRSRDMLEIENIYSQAGVSYKGTGIQYRMPKIAHAALHALGHDKDRLGQISRLGVMDTAFIKSGAIPEIEARLLEEIDLDWSDLSSKSFQERGLRDVRFLSDGLQTDVEAVAANLMENDCYSTDDWYSKVVPELQMQTFYFAN